MLYIVPAPSTSLLQGTACYPTLQALENLAVFTRGGPIAYNIHIQTLRSFYRC